MAKAIGSEIVDFYLNGWPEGYYCDESVLEVTSDGKIVKSDDPETAPSLPLTDRYELSDFGAIIAEQGSVVRDFSFFFNKWKKAKTTATLVIEVDKDQEQAVRDLLAAAGIKVV